MKLKFLILLGGSLFAQPLCAQDNVADEAAETITIADPLRDSLITVLANGTREPLDWTGDSVSVFDREAMDAADLERATLRLDELDLGAGERLLELGGQTGRLGEVVSLHAVLDADLHAGLLEGVAAHPGPGTARPQRGAAPSRS